VKGLVAEMHQVSKQATEAGAEDLSAIGTALSVGIAAVEEATAYILNTFGQNPRAVAAGSVPYLMLLGTVCGGWQMARAALVAQKKLAAANADESFYQAKIATARFYADHLLPRSASYRHEILNGAASTLRLDEGQF